MSMPVDPSDESLQGVRVIYQPSQRETGEWIRQAVPPVLRYLSESWGLSAPADCRIYVMTSWWKFTLQSAPLVRRLILLLSFPLWGPRARRTWALSSGWSLLYAQYTAIGIKPPSLLEASDKQVGKFMYVEVNDPQDEIRQLVCHELVHACTARLRLPAWLNEGLAMVAVEQLLGKTTIQPDTLQLVGSFQPKDSPATYRQLYRLEKRQVAYQLTRGYWLVRYLEEQHPGFLKQQLSLPDPLHTLEAEVARKLGIPADELWQQVDALLVGHFTSRQ